MTPFEWLAAGYFLALLPIAVKRSQPRRGIMLALGASALVIVARLALPVAGRAWLAHIYLVLGYWIPAAFVEGRNRRFEQWLTRADARLALRLPAATHVYRELLELAYLCCYPLVPAAFVVVYVNGSIDDVVRFWVGTLAAGYACYISLPWSAAIPPRLAERAGAHAPRSIAAVNALVLGRVSHQLVTFPSGHVAVSVAVAVGVWRVSPTMGYGFGVVALLIAAAAVIGRYHYVVDVLLGLGVGALVASVGAWP